MALYIPRCTPRYMSLLSLACMLFFCTLIGESPLAYAEGGECVNLQGYPDPTHGIFPPYLPSSPTKVVRLRIWRIRGESGGDPIVDGPTAEFSDIEPEVELARGKYEAHGIYLRIVGDEEIDAPADPLEPWASFPGHASHAINVYVYPLGTSYGQAGYASGLGGNGLYVAADWASHLTFAHELGHCLGLIHPFEGTGTVYPFWSEDWCGYWDEVEGVMRGDLVCDTPPTVEGLLAAENCEFPGWDPGLVASYPQLELNVPLLDNLMDRIFECRDGFTPEQAARMHVFLETVPDLLAVQDPVESLGSELVAVVNSSVETGITIPQDSSPSACVPLNFTTAGEDKLMDLFIGFKSAERAQLLENTLGDGDTPEYQLRTSALHNGYVDNVAGAAAVDCLNADGNVDLFIATSSGNLLLAGDGFDFSSGGSIADYDKSTALGSAQTVAAHGASFGDFNGDRWLDLYVISAPATSGGTGDVLLQSNAGASFTDVTSAAGLRPGMTEATSALWADINYDGRMDLFVGWEGPVGPNNEWSPFYLNEGPDAGGQVTFTDVAGATTGPRMPKHGHVQAIEAADLDGNRQLDLVLASNDPAAPSTLIACLNDGSGALTEAPATLGLQTQTPLIDVEVTDLNGNGVLDVVAVPDGANDIEVFSGYGDVSERGYRDASFEAGLGADATYGLTLADFNSDTDTDVFLLRPESGTAQADKKFYWANGLVDATSPPASPVSFTVEFDRWTGSLNPNSLGIGAMVTSKVITPGGQVLNSTQVIDGGSGHSGQGSSRVTFGLAGASTAEITVRWPHGQTQVFDAASCTGFPNVVLKDTSDPGLQSSSVTWSYIPNDGYTTHTFTWLTDVHSGTPQVLVDAGSRALQSCKVPLGGVSQLLLDPSMAGVDAPEPVEQPDGTWLNTLTWEAYCSSMCNYTYYARQVVGGQVYSSSPKTMNVTGCVTITQ